MSKISFAPLEPDAVTLLTARTGVEYRHIDFSLHGWFCVTARKDEKIQGIFIAEFINPYEAHITCEIEDPSFLTRRLLRAIFGTLFSQAVRLTGLTRPENEAAIRILKHLGFRYEGFLRKGIEGQWDALMFGLLRNECRYLGKMTPTLPLHDQVNSPPTDPKLLSEPATRGTGFSNFQNLFDGQFGLPVPFADDIPLVSGAVPHVFEMGLPDDMPRVAAGGIGTLMRGNMALWHRAMGNFANQLRHLSYATLPAHLWIAALIGWKRPKQAVVSFISDSFGEEQRRCTIRRSLFHTHIVAHVG